MPLNDMGTASRSLARRRSECNASSRAGWIDISSPVRNGMVHWPSDPSIQIGRTRDMERGDSSNLSTISMGSHTGTHIDAPVHFIPGGEGIDKMPLDTAMGRARVVEIQDIESVKPEELLKHRLRRGERLLLKTRNSQRNRTAETFIEDFVFISKEAAHFLGNRRIRLVGVDYLSVGGYKRDGAEIHRILLGAGVWIIEGLDLSGVEPGKYHLVCLPMKLVDADGAPARAALRPF